MSALDMVLQRQVPARPVAKGGEGFTGADAAGDNRSDAFSAALSHEKRSSAAEPQDKRTVAAQSDKVETGEEAEVGAETGEPEDQLDTGSGQSDDVLNLLSGLMSSAAYSEEAELGKVDPAEVGVVDAAPDDETAVADTEAAEVPEAKSADAAVVAKPGMAGSDDVDAVASKAAAPETANPRARAGTVPAETGAPAAAVQKAATTQSGGVQPVQQASAEARAAVAAPAAQVTVAAGALKGQGAQVAPRSSSANEAGSDRQKDQAAIREVMRALGMEEEARPVEVRIRGRGTGGQANATERRGDELAGTKNGKVEVIESRRFMPLQNMSANAQLVTRSLVDAGNAALTAQRAAPLQPAAQAGPQQAGQTLHTLKLQLNPVSLGSVTAVLKLSGEDLSVEIKVQTAEAYRQIKQDNESIIKALRGQGFGVEQITVQHVAGPDRASSQTAQQGFQPSQQGPGSSDAQSSGSENGRNNAGQQRAGSQGGQGHEQSSYAGSGAGRADGVYL